MFFVAISFSNAIKPMATKFSTKKASTENVTTELNKVLKKPPIKGITPTPDESKDITITKPCVRKLQKMRGKTNKKIT